MCGIIPRSNNPYPVAPNANAYNVLVRQVVAEDGEAVVAPIEGQDAGLEVPDIDGDIVPMDLDDNVIDGFGRDNWGQWQNNDQDIEMDEIDQDELRDNVLQHAHIRCTSRKLRK